MSDQRPRTLIAQPASRHPFPDSAPPTERQVRVAVNSKVMKLSSRLIAICQRLEKESPVPVAFTFFPGERGLNYDGLEAAIKSQIPSANVMMYIQYNAFLQEVAKCDLALAAFPFGNTNSTVDTALLGIPTVAHFGPESPAQSDRQMLMTAGLADWLVCRSDDEYYETALELIKSPERRLAALNGQTRAEIARRLFSNESAQTMNPFAEICFYLFRYHDDLRLSDSRVINYQSLLND